MRILIVHNSYQQRGGEDTVFEQELGMLKAAGHEVAAYHRDNTEIRDFSRARRAMVPLRTVWADDARAGFIRLLRSYKPEIVHIHNTFMLISPAIYGACQRFGVPVVTTLHNYRLLCPASNFFRKGKVCEECVDHSLLRSIRYGCYRNSRTATATVAAMLAYHRARKSWINSDCLIALTEFARNKFITSGFPKEKLVIKPNFVDPDPGLGSEIRSGALFAGRLTEEKGVRTLLSAWEALPRTLPLTIIGDGPLKSELMARAHAANLHNVHFIGAVHRRVVLEAIKRASVVIFPSEWYESFAITLLEACACGTPLIASDIGAIREIVDHGTSGFLFRPGDSQMLTRTVESAFANPELMNMIGKKARQLYLSKYTASQNLGILIGIYERCINNLKAAPEAAIQSAA